MILLTTDLHFTDRAADEYRWGIFEVLRQTAAQYRVSHIAILGDLTDEKDKHSARLVNKVVSEIYSLQSTTGSRVILLKGNHDYQDPNCPFFGFLGENGAPIYNTDRVVFVSKPWSTTINGSVCLFLPHTRTPAADWAKLPLDTPSQIFCHQTFSGARSGDYELEGISPKFFHDRGFDGPVFSGDIHYPQCCGPVVYVGSPYHVRFGDRYDPRIIVFDEKHGTWIGLSTGSAFPRKRVVDLWGLDWQDELEELDLKPGDQAKVRLHLSRSDFVSFAEAKRDVDEAFSNRAVTVKSIDLKPRAKRKRVKIDTKDVREDPRATRAEQWRAFCKERRIDDSVRDVGAGILSLD